LRLKASSVHKTLCLWLRDVANDVEEPLPEYIDNSKVIFVHNKTDLLNVAHKDDDNNIYISVKMHAGLEKLLSQLAARLHGTDAIQEASDTPFLARNRHVVALQKTQDNLSSAEQHIASNLELTAEDLRVAQQRLGEITGEFTPDDLLGKIFSEFCIGK